MNTTNKTFTHPTYAAAMAALNSGACRFARWDAGEGYVAEGEYNHRTKRVTTRTFNPDGSRCA